MVDEKLEVLFEVHQRIGEEIGKSDYLGDEEGEFNEGHINGLKEANLRVEETIYDLIENGEGGIELDEPEPYSTVSESKNE